MLLRTIRNLNNRSFSTLHIPQLLDLGIKNRNIKYNLVMNNYLKMK